MGLSVVGNIDKDTLLIEWEGCGTMKAYRWLTMLMVVMGLIILIVGDQVCADDDQDAVLTELQVLRVEVEQLRSEVRQLKDQAAASKNDETVIDVNDWQAHRQKLLENLKAIQRPKNPTHEEAVNYILDICDVLLSEGDHWITPDLPVYMISRLGSKHVDAMIEALDQLGEYFMASRAIHQAIQQTANQQHKQMILDALNKHHDLVNVVLKRGWIDEAYPILLDGMQNSGVDYLPEQWIASVASKKDPASYPVLREYFIRSENHAGTFKWIKSLPIENIEEAVAEAWNNSLTDYEFGPDGEMARIAVEFGHLDAMDYLIEQMQDPNFLRSRNYRKIRATVKKHLDFKGSSNELIEWYETNHDKLQFDNQSRKYYVADQLQ